MTIFFLKSICKIKLDSLLGTSSVDKNVFKILGSSIQPIKKRRGFAHTCLHNCSSPFEDMPPTATPLTLVLIAKFLKENTDRNAVKSSETVNLYIAKKAYKTEEINLIFIIN